MGGGGSGGETYYERHVNQSSINPSQSNDYRISGTDRPKEKKVDKSLNPKNSNRDCPGEYFPVVIISDFTQSRGDDIQIIDKKLPMLVGEINARSYLPRRPAISFVGIGDATIDKIPVQIGQFYPDDRLDKVLQKMWIEMGGGGTGEESYELIAYYFAFHSVLNPQFPEEKGLLFFIGDESFYPAVSKDQIKNIFGDDIPQDLDTKTVFALLQEKFEVFFLFPQQSPKTRKENIDAEIKKRVEQAGGLYEGIDIRASLMWHDRNDLDLHIITPDRYHIYFSQPKSSCGGFLDVDMNVHGETTKPVENIRWAKGKAKKGRYRVFVRNFRYHEKDSEITPFSVEVEINGEVQHFQGAIPPFQTGDESDVDILSFDYDPDQRPTVSQDNRYDNYQTAKIVENWASIIPSENIIVFSDPAAIVDEILGLIKISTGGTLEDYLIEMKQRDQSDVRCQIINSSLQFKASLAAPAIDFNPNLSNTLTNSKTKRKNNSQP